MSLDYARRRRSIRQPWPQERLDHLATLWRSGMTGAAIAIELGNSRSAIMGMLRRLGLSNKDRGAK